MTFISLRFSSHFPAGTRMSPFWILLELRMMEVMTTTEPTRRAKLTVCQSVDPDSKQIAATYKLYWRVR